MWGATELLLRKTCSMHLTEFHEAGTEVPDRPEGPATIDQLLTLLCVSMLVGQFVSRLHVQCRASWGCLFRHLKKRQSGQETAGLQASSFTFFASRGGL